ncbi:phage gene 29 protein family protein [Mycobacterium marinum]|uniref:phage gene 29 protein family protein n=1 Tax=Mycobacterium marinum TaxID=1781 RepID=UPI000B968738|nr:DUF2744 domain-containing protein [Mycobacterium marinum]
MPAQTIPPDFKEFTKGLPTRDNCDLADPYEMFLWCFVALPYVNGGPLIMPINYYQFVSKRLHDLGVMLVCENCGHSKAPTLKYQPPLNTDPHFMTSPGQWVNVDAPDRDPRPPAAQAVDGLISQQQVELLQELWSRCTPAQREHLVATIDGESAQ